jgi:nucleoside-diphosphate-sugar epimerase
VRPAFDSRLLPATLLGELTVRVLVTGASGFLGGVVCDELLQRDHEVHALVRREGSQPPGTAALAGDLTDAGSLRSAVESVAPECVVHLAAEIASQRDPAKVERVNVDGTRSLIAACEAAGVGRIVFSSTVVTGDAKGAVLDEETELPVETAYGRSKQEGERLLRESTLEEVIIRPSHVYGPGGWFVEEFVDRIRQPGRFAVIGAGENWWDVVRVEDVARACVDAAERAPAGALYHVVDDQPITFYDFVALAATALGKGPPRRIPAWLARVVAGADPVRAVTRSAKSSNAHIKSELGWEPCFPTAREGVPDAIARLAQTASG